MKHLWVLLMLAVAATNSLAEPQPISSADRREISALLKRIHDLESNDAEDRKANLERIEQKIGYRDENGRVTLPSVDDPAYGGSTDSQVAIQRETRRKWITGRRVLFEELPQSEKAVYAAAAALHKRNQDQLRSLYTEAIQKTMAAYHIAPPKSGGVIVNGPLIDPTGESIPSFRGRAIEWRPVFQASEDPARNGQTDPNGDVRILPLAFRALGKDRDRDVDHLGRILFHESLHFADELDPDADLKNVPEVELRHRQIEDKYIGKVFHLSAEDIENDKAKRRQLAADAELWRDYMKQGRNPWEKRDFPLFRGASKGSDYLGTAAAPAGLDEFVETDPEPIEKDGQDNFFGSIGSAQGITQDAIDTFEANERHHRAEQIRQDQEEKRALAEAERRRQERARQYAANACGVHEDFRDENPSTPFGFHRGSRPFYYRADLELDAERIEAAYALAERCITAHDMDVHDHYYTPDPCGNGLSAMQQRWSDSNFRYELYMSDWVWQKGRLPRFYIEDPHYCITYVINNLQSPFTLDKFRQTLQDYRTKLLEYRREYDEAMSKRQVRNQPSGNGGQGAGNQGGGPPIGRAGSGAHCPDNCSCDSYPIHCPAAPL